MPATVIGALPFSAEAGLDNAAVPTGALLNSVAAAGLADADGAATTTAACGKASAKATGALSLSAAAGFAGSAEPPGALLNSVAAAGLADADGAATTAAGGRASAKATGALSLSAAAGFAESAEPLGALLISVAAAGLANAAGISVGSSSVVSLREDWRATPLGALASSVDLAPGADLSSALIDFGAEAAAAGCGAVERSVPFVVRGPSTWVSVRVSAAAIPDPPVKAAPANAAPTPRPTAPTPSQE